MTNSPFLLKFPPLPLASAEMQKSKKFSWDEWTFGCFQKEILHCCHGSRQICACCFAGLNLRCITITVREKNQVRIWVHEEEHILPPVGLTPHPPQPGWRLFCCRYYRTYLCSVQQWASHAADTVDRYSKRLQAAQCCKPLCFLAQSHARSACHKEVSQWSNDINGIGHAI